MDFEQKEEQKAIVAMAEQFAREEIAPHAAQWDIEHHFPVDTFRKAAQLGFAGIYVRSDVGGSELSRLDAALVFESLSTACVSTAAYLSIHNMVAWLIDTYGSTELRKHYCPKLCEMSLLSSYCLTEPEAGSDAAALSTSAVREGDHYILNGSKAFISGAGASDLYAVMVRTSDDGAKGITCLLVEKETEGLSFGKLEDKLGWRNQPTRMIFFNECRVPVSNRLGEEGEGFPIALRALNGGRINIGACSLGGAAACLQATRQYMHERQQFKQKLTQFQHLQFQFADLIAQLDAARLLIYRAAHSLDTTHPEVITHCAMAKRFASDAAFNISDACLQIFGGYGYLRDYPIERYFRDLRVHQILEGSNEIMRLIIARRVLEDTFNI